ncbi:hypothetical protein MTsPCn9_03230 [Croceitalea sp. MTPC9]|uniref:DUF6515 family protein n=1 Tax=unclassified Croceitalea TaxID=2632280 RepID=UPI002B388839|nr:hypothetical protein MTsPCn6_05480 [Croceitalea sp. MTPC6]GMN15387.1 hypothetical protein MTsPCn9_03230 [Croceitalea sp. MTPC9]
MKNLKITLVVMALFGAMIAVNAQTTVVRVYPKHGKVVTTVKKPRVVVHKKTNFYFADGIWYKARGRKYVVCAAPVGVKVRRLPRGNKVVVVNGRKLYKYRGVWYKKSGRNFVVVNV